MNTKYLGIGLLAALALAVAPLGSAQSVFSHADHYQTNQVLQTDADDTDAGEGLVSTYAGVDWVFLILILGDGAFISQATGITWIDLTISAELTLNGSPVTGDNGEDVILPSSGTQLQFISGDEQYPNAALPTPLYANPAAGADVIVLTSDTNATASEYNSNGFTSFGPGTGSTTAGTGQGNLTGTWYIYDIFEFVDTGALKLVENFAPATNQTGSWTSGFLPSFYVPSLVSEVVIGVSFDYDEADGVRNARLAHTGGATVFGPTQALRFIGNVEDEVVFA